MLSSWASATGKTESGTFITDSVAILDDRRREFVARNIADVGKAVLAVTLASYFFERLPLWLRWTLPILGFVFLISSVWIHPKQKEG